jgi:predicted O-linked N-acetylglucosamine transferase (SPINDLY family)
MIAPIIQEHNRDSVEVFCYGHDLENDAVAAFVRDNCDHWRNISSMNDESCAELVRDDAIDILIDLSLHTAKNHLRLFACKPAPVQVTYLGYCSTTGLPEMDYRLSDHFLDPPGTDMSFYSEETVHLEPSYWCYMPPAAIPYDPDPPVIASGVFTFGCLNNLSKVSRSALLLWSKILKGVPASKLLLYAAPGQHRLRISDLFHEQGIFRDRIEFVGGQPFEKYLDTYRRIDVTLDPFPCTGGITSCDSLWMGVPMVTLAGKGLPVSRGGCSLLSNVGLNEFIANDTEQYCALAVRAADDIPRLREMRRTLRERMIHSPLMDKVNYMRNLESVYRVIWQRWCAKQKLP